MSLAPVLRFVAFALLAVAAACVVPGLLAAAAGSAALPGYVLGCVLALFLGGTAYGLSLTLPRRASVKSGLRELLLALLILWAGVPLVAAVPFAQQGWAMADAWFEAVSALTTTGGWLSAPSARATVEGAIYRASLQWMGGLVSLCTAAAIFVRPEFMGVAPLVPPFARGESGSYLRAFSAAFGVFLPVFAGLTALAAIAFMVLGVGAGEGAVMAMSFMATGGFVPRAGGIAGYGPWVQGLAAIVMLVGAANFIGIAALATGRGRRMRGGGDRETLTLLLLCPLVALVFWLSLGAGDWDRMPAQLFNAVSVLTTNGIRIGEAPQLTPVLVAVVVGGAAVSTAGGIKLLRWLVTFRRAGEELWKLAHPGGVSSRRASVDQFGVWIHTIAFTILLAAIVLVTAFFGVSLEASVATAAAVVANAGPVLGYAPMTTADWVLFDPALRPVFVVGMIAGRLELVVMLALFSRRFWSN